MKEASIEDMSGKSLKEYLNSGIFSQAEAEKIFMLNMYSITDYSDMKKRETDLKEIFVSWFRKELKSAQEARGNIMVYLKLKKIEEELYFDLSFNEILEKYEKFKNILLGNNIL